MKRAQHDFQGRLGRVAKWVSICASAALAWAGCLGGGIDTFSSADGVTGPSVIQGTVVNASGEPIGGAVVRLHPSGFDPTLPNVWLPVTDTTDSLGRYRLNAPSGTGPGARYTVTAANGAGTLTGFADSLVARDRHDVFDTVRLTAPYRVLVSFAASDTSLGATSGGVVYVPGTDLVATLSGFRAELPSVPERAGGVVVRFENGVRVSYTLIPRAPGAGSDPRDTLRFTGFPASVMNP